MNYSSSQTDLVQEINRLKAAKKALILAHYYQVPEIQDIADFVGDSLALSRKAAETDAELIVFAGVHFMAETAKILNPSKKVVLPDLKAGCSLADSCPPADFKSFREAHPDHTVVTYINCTAEVKTLSDVICTSSNALQIINSFPKDQKLIFAPDVNMGRYLNKETGRDMLLWDGACIVHEAFDLEKILNLKAEHPEAKIIAHPESETPILKVANFIGSTAALLRFAQEDASQSFIVATEHGILHKMQQLMPEKTFIPAPALEDNTCACSECAFMKVNTLEKLRNCLRDEQPEILLPDSIMKEALRPLNRMFELS
ncbi:quinolinate synthase NadA [Croceimicrobium hydrocarbonivorans]|uniref:Quinolinate synthase n=1 Tax=Croceimicrobium hydrocarbonivorans TaxID=2761580 RepID=A0A7H0VIN5_9FLAO|nr:quinolinate synthase NadA [Croceimicrobium hydrocarbonivorans]QNR25583.1 quinolinate synthase NadA [Croceimicrobium hydrocarbonivorans]